MNLDSNLQKIRELTTQKLGVGAAGLRSLAYLLESLPIQWADQWVMKRSGQNFKQPTVAQLNAARDKAFELFERDWQNVKSGLYPVPPEFYPELSRHAWTYSKILADGIGVMWRKLRKQYHDVPVNAFTQDLPDYYLRNFHGQTDGYLSRASAEIYDHQVEILFRGAAGAMRRLLLPPMLKHLKSYPTLPKVIDIGAGTGSASLELLHAGAQVDLTLVDLSADYLNVAYKRLSRFPRVGIVPADATQLPFQDQSFSAAMSVFMYHELPKAERIKSFKEAFRILKPGGQFCIVDSLQWDDVPELNWGLENFPMGFHEPFYTNYVKNHLDPLLRDVGFQITATTTGLYSKLWVLRRP